MSETNFEKKVLVGVSELTAILTRSIYGKDDFVIWKEIAERLIRQFTFFANLEGIFGKRKVLEGTPPEGCTVAYQYGDNPFYFAVAYHPSCPKLGVIVKFSAYSWAVYCRKAKVNIKSFLNSPKKIYRIHLSSIDFTIDYQNWDISVNDIYQNLKNNRLKIHNHKGEVNHFVINGYETDGKASIFYVESKKTGTRLFLWIYDKKLEQVAQNGFSYEEALNTKTWVRFEAVFKGEYAYKLTDLIMITSKRRLEKLIIEKVAENYRFYDLESKEYTEFTRALVEKPEKNFDRKGMGTSQWFNNGQFF